MQTTIRWGIQILFGFLILNGANLKAQVSANFSASKTDGCGVVQTSFTDLSSSGNNTGIINSWNWDFGSASSNLESPGFTFSSPGTFTICLTVSTTTGATDTECKTDYVEVYSLPTPNFTVDEADGCVPHTVTFTDQTASNATISSYIWGVGGQAGVIIDDGSLPAIVNTYDNADTYTVSLTVEDENGCVNSISKPGLIQVFDNPDIQVTPLNTFACDPPLVTSFTNDNIEPNTIYTWDFGNGQTFTGTTPGQITYTAPGSYTVSVSANNTEAGCTADIVMTDVISIGHPASISSDLQSLCLGGAVNFSDDGDIPADSYTWDFGDGNTANTANPTHVYNSSGCFTVVLTRVVGGCVSNLALPYCVQVNDLPTGSYGLDLPIGCSLPHNVNFNSSVPLGSSVVWDFGDGNTSTQANPNHDYTNFGTYNVTLTIVDINGCESTLTGETVQVQETVANLSFFNERGCVPLSFVLDESSQSIVPIVSWQWEILDNAAIPPIIYTSNLENPFVTLPDTGVFDIRLTVTNSLGCSSTRAFQERIEVGDSPNTQFTVSPADACRMEAVYFTDASSPFSDEWIWNFGDGEIVEDQNTSHQYTTVGLFTVSLISSHNGCRDTLEKVDVVNVQPPRAIFEVELFCNSANYREFTNTTTDSDIVSWDFGVLGSDADTSSLESPSFNYPGPGTYYTTMVAENLTTGCSDTMTQEVIITDLIPEIAINDSIGCAPFVLDVSNTSIDAQAYTWLVPGANINNANIESPIITYTNGGMYSDVQLMVEDINGCLDTIILATDIEVNELTASLLPSTITGCAGAPVDFTNTSSANFNTIISSNWVVGNNLSNQNTDDASYTFADAGDYEIQLTVEDDGGCINTIVHPELVNITKPEASYASEKYACTFSPLALNSTSNGEGLNFAWDFGDGNNSVNENTSHQFAVEGQYDVCLTITDKNGCVSSSCEDERIIVVDPVAAFSVDNAYGACPPMLATFVNNSNNAINYSWDFGDNSGESDLENPPHVFTEPGTFDVSLVAYTSEVCTDTLKLDDYIVLEGPIGDFSFVVDNFCAPASVTFEGGSLDQYDYYWDFGDGTIDTTYFVDNDTLAYSYANIGTYKPKLILVDNQFCQRIIESPDSIVMGGFDFDFLASDSLYCGNDAFTTLFLYEGESSHSIQEASWLFPGSQTPISTTSSPLVTYDSPGTYDVQLILDNGACRDTITKENFIRFGAVPDADLVVDAAEGCYPLTVNFTDMSSIAGGSITEWNWDFGNGSNSSNQNPTMLFDQVGVNTVDFSVKSAIGCESTEQIEIEVFALPEAEIVGETNICVGEMALLQGTILSGEPGGSTTWSGGTVDCPSCLETEVSPPSTTTYLLSVVDGNGCTTSEVHEVYVRDAIAAIIDLGPDTTACMGTGVELMLSVDQSMVTINWSTDEEGLSCYQNCPNPLATPTEATLFKVTAVNVDGCISEDSIMVNVLDDRREFATEDLTICEGDSANLLINYGTDPVWSSSAEIDCTNCPEIMVGPITESKYYVEVMSENNCLIQDSVLVAVQAPMEVEAGEDEVACIEAGVTLSGVGEGIDYSWFPIEGTEQPNAIETKVLPTETTMYYFTVDDGICQSMDSVLVEVITHAEVFADGGSICQGDTIALVGDGLAAELLWYGESENMIGTGNDISITPTRTAGYSLVGTLPGCESDTAYFTVEVHDIPVVEYPESVTILPESSVQIQPTIGNSEGLIFQWSPADELSCGSCPDPFASPSESKTFTVEILDPSTGCSITEEIEFRQRSKCGPDLISMPNVFSPNRDGRNDEVFILGNTINSINAFRVYNRWGAEVFYTDDIAQGWNGTYREKKLPSGVYVYIIEAECPIDGSIFYKQGDITILR